MIGKNKKIILSVLLAVVVSVWISGNAFASDLTISKKIASFGISKCYDALKNNVRIDDLSVYIRDSGYDGSLLFDDDKTRVLVPNNIISGEGGDSPTLSCKDFLFGAEKKEGGWLWRSTVWSWEGPIDFNDYQNTNYTTGSDGDPEHEKVLLFGQKLGYEEKAFGSSSGTTRKCLYLQYKDMNYKDDEGITVSNPSNALCFNLDKNGNIQNFDISQVKTVNDDDGDKPAMRVIFGGMGDDRGGYITIEKQNNMGRNDEIGRVELTIGGSSYEDAYNSIVGILREYDDNNASDRGSWFRISDNDTRDNKDDDKYLEELTDGDTEGILTYSTILEHNSESKNNMSRNLIGIDSSTNLSLAEIVNLYFKYLSNKDYVEIDCQKGGVPNAEEKSLIPVKIKYEGKITKIEDAKNGENVNSEDVVKCYAKEIDTQYYNGGYEDGNTNTYMFTHENMSLREIIDFLNSADLESVIDDLDNVSPNADSKDLQLPDPTDSTDTTNSTSSTKSRESVSTEGDCKTSAGSLSWLICPIIDGLGNFIQTNYAKWIEPALQVNVGLFNGDRSESDGVYVAWSTFAGIANVLFVIYFIFVIFSQVTGFGAEKYGLRATLPKLLVAAILINLSFIICVLAIDVGNIAGRGIGSLFTSIREKITIQETYQVDVGSGNVVDVNETAWNNVVDTTVSTVVPIVVIVVGILTFFQVLWYGGLAFIIPILLTLISVAFAIFSLIIILGIRQAAIVLLVAVSPIAFACYMLPNTKPIFNKWFDAFKGLLLAFPICSALVYGGDLVGAILLNSANGQFWLLISAAVVTVAPIFFIPKVISQSMGAISMGIARFSKGSSKQLRGAANERLQHSVLTRRRDYTRRMHEQKAEARTSEYNAKRGSRYLSKHSGENLATMSAGERRQYNAAKAAVKAHNQSAEEAYSTDFSSKSDSEITNSLMNAAENGKLDENMLVAAIGSYQHDSDLTSAFKGITNTDAYKKIMKNNPDARRRVGDAMANRSGSIVNQGIGRAMQNGTNVQADKEGNWEDDSLKAIRTQVQTAGTNVMASQTKELFNTKGAADLLSDDQIRAAAASGYTGETAEAFSGMMSNNAQVTADRKNRIVSRMTAQQVASLTSGEHGSLKALGGAQAIQAHNSAAINTLKSDDGKELRTRMDGTAMKELFGATKGDNTPDTTGGTA